MTTVDLEIEISAEILERAIKDIMDWAGAKDPGPTKIAEATGFSRQMVYRAKNDDWDPPVSTIVKMAYAKQALTQDKE